MPIEPQRHERLLLAGLRSGLNLPYECATGTCGNCAATVVSGEVTTTWPEAPGSKALKGRADRILLCQCEPAGNCTIEFQEPSALVPGAASIPAHGNAKVSGVERLADGLYEVDVECDTAFAPAPGQFMLLAAEGIAGYRAYSVSRAANGGRTLSFVVRANPSGSLSQRLCERSAVGATFRIFGPLGRAFLAEQESGDVSVVVGGSGLAVAMAIADHMASAAKAGTLRLFIGLKRADCEPVLAWLASLVTRTPERKIAVSIVLSEDQPPEHAGHPFAFHHGLVHQVALDDMPVWSRDTLIFVAGPPPMVNLSIQGFYRSRRFSPAQIRYDRFS